MARDRAPGPRKQDFSARMARNCREAHSILDELLPLAKRYSFAGVPERSRVDRLLVRLQVCAGRVLRIAVPLPNGGEFHGLPAEVCDSGAAPKAAVIHRGKPGWNFRPWLSEKTIRLWKSVDRIFEGFETDQRGALDFILNGRQPQGKIAPAKELEEILRDLLISQIKGARYLTQTLDDMLRTKGLTVAEVRPPEQDD